LKNERKILEKIRLPLQGDSSEAFSSSVQAPSTKN